MHRLLCKILDAAADKSEPELTIMEDNQSCIKMTKNPVNHGRAKHIDIKYHHIRDEVKRGDVKLEYYETSMMLADILTKGLPGPHHKDLTVALGYTRVRIKGAYCELTVEVLSSVTKETVNLSKSIPRNYGKYLPMSRRIG